jgi:uroporphyrinogen-III synthase
VKRSPRPQPLDGKRVLTTRARKQAGSLAALLRHEGARVLTIPCIEIRPPRSYRPLDQALRNLASYQWLILTSVNGVEALFARARRLRLKPAELRRLKYAAIGPATARALEERGLPVEVVPREYIAESVVRALRNRVGGENVLLVRAAVARDVIPRELRRAGARVDVVDAYETIVPKDSSRRLKAALAAATRPEFITFTSSSTAKNFVALVGRRERLRGIKLASIGPVTSATLRSLGLRPAIEAKEYTMAGLVRAIVARHNRAGRKR